MGGMDLHDYQQNFVVDRAVKVSFFATDNALARILGGPSAAPVRVASLAELFKAKSLVSALRSKTRDWLDLYLLMRDHGFSPNDYRGAFVEAGIEGQWEIGLSRLCSGVVPKEDEGYTHLLPQAPSLDVIKEYFNAMRDQFEIARAAEEQGKRRIRPESGI